jgi:hypothetical protein
MLTRRLTACACALALAVPAVASARPAADTPTKASDHVAYGDTKYDLQNKQDLGSSAVKGDTKNDAVVTDAERIGSLTSKQLAAAYGGGGRLQPAHIGTPASAGSPDDDTNGWQIAAVAEAGLLAALALGSAAFVARTRPRRGAAA